MEERLCGCGCGQRTKLITQPNKRRGHVKGEYLRFIVGHNARKFKGNPPWDTIRDEYEEGFSVTYLGKKYGISSGAIYRGLHILKAHIRKPWESFVAMKRAGIIKSNSKDKHWNWKGGRKYTSNGYVQIYNPGHHRSDCNGYVLEHILVWEKAHGKPLPKKYCVHHFNGIRDDNRPQNLTAIKRGEHSNLAEPYKKRIRELEIIIQQLQQPLLPNRKGENDERI